MSIIVACECGKKFQAKEEHVGKRANCPNCGRMLVIATQVPAVSNEKLAASSEPARLRSSSDEPIRCNRATPPGPSKGTPPATTKIPEGQDAGAVVMHPQGACEATVQPKGRPHGRVLLNDNDLKRKFTRFRSQRSQAQFFGIVLILVGVGFCGFALMHLVRGTPTKPPGVLGFVLGEFLGIMFAIAGFCIWRFYKWALLVYGVIFCVSSVWNLLQFVLSFGTPGMIVCLFYLCGSIALAFELLYVWAYYDRFRHLDIAETAAERARSPFFASSRDVPLLICMGICTIAFAAPLVFLGATGSPNPLAACIFGAIIGAFLGCTVGLTIGKTIQWFVERRKRGKERGEGE